MARPTTKTTAPVGNIELLPAATKRIENAQDAMAVESRDIAALAHELGYEGALTVGTIEDEIRFYQRRTVEALLECGKRLLLLKKIAPHGEFRQRVEMLGFSYQTAARFMQAAAKTAKSLNLRDLSAQVKNASAFLELVTHDDDALESIKDMDDIDRMSASQLREKLRQAEQDNKFLAEKRDKEQQRADKAEKALRSGGPKARSLEERVSEFDGDVNQHQDAAMAGLLNIDQQVKALEAWYLQYMSQQPDFEPGERMPMPVEVLALVQKLSGNVDRIAAAVGGLQSLIWNSFGDELGAVTRHEMIAPAETEAQAA